MWYNDETESEMAEIAINLFLVLTKTRDEVLESPLLIPLLYMGCNPVVNIQDAPCVYIRRDPTDIYTIMIINEYLATDRSERIVFAQ